MLEPSSSEEEDEDYLQEQNGYGQLKFENNNPTILMQLSNIS